MTALTALKDMPISFPGLFGEWSFNPDVIAIHIGHGVYWYGVILALGFLAGLLLCMRQAPKYGLTSDNVLDLVLWAVPCCILGSRVYYVLFNLDLYRNASGGLDFGRMIAIWDGGLAIYGTVIAGALVAYCFSRRRKIPFGALADLCVMGLLLGQVIGRWANFINREAFGSFTDLPWRMRLWVSSYQYIEVHPTFLYESLWNLAGLALILLVVSKGRRFDGENTAFYFLWYGLGRCWIEGLRTDSLYLFGLSFLGEPVRVSQALSFLLALAGAGLLFYQLCIRRASAISLYVNRLAEERQPASPEAEQDAPPELEDILEAHGSDSDSGSETTESDSDPAAAEIEAASEETTKKEAGPDTDAVESGLETDSDTEEERHDNP